jgi:hypothetical protein
VRKAVGDWTVRYAVPSELRTNSSNSASNESTVVAIW